MPAFFFAPKVDTMLARVYEDLSFLPKVGSFIWVAAIVLFLLPYASARSRKCHGRGHRHIKKQETLFPSIEKVVISPGFAEEPLVEAFPQPCSTGLTTRLLPFKNAKGEIEWVFTDDVQPGRELDAFKASPGTFKATPQLPKAVKIEKQSEILSPVTSNSSNNESISEKKSESATPPQVNTPSSSSSEDHKEEGEDGEGEVLEGENGAHLHECPHCDAKFRMRGYLTRHLKKHMSQKAYKCPFRELSTYKDENDNTHQCHPSGGFSRRDTYKTHLKTRHFKFPAGTPIKGRSQSPGNCAMCGEWFQNAEIWSEIHVEGAECKFLPPGFKGKSRIKNKLKKQMARLMKEEKKFKSKSKKGSNMDYISPGTATADTTPSMSNPSYDYEESPTHSSCSPMGQHRFAHPTLHDQFSRDLQQRSVFAYSPMSEHNLGMTPNGQSNDDYDDEFCLDTEQMSVPTMQPIYSPPHMGCNGISSTELSAPYYHSENAYPGYIR